ncbi:NYN domain-containing protein [Myxacorys almedinensis]|uniref:NYN domain-containing protein n=1 Tax=Myxacorys almedinensis A TaxID=2690445 RepID=A0A8J7Z5L2_9CYAN|nr:NYN domain-containing protein [Myxacorys almedinensis]NDJ18518.1 NYN domain-containing protein [Myxacorys almedinensis A]
MLQPIPKKPVGEKTTLHLEPIHFPEHQLPIPFSEQIGDPNVLEDDRNPLEPRDTNRGRVIMFIDGANLFYAASQMGIEIDYAKLLRYFRHNSQLAYAFFYTGVDPTNSRQQAFLTWMRRNGYRVVTKDVVHNAAGTKRASSMNVEIAVDMVRMASSCDTEVVISGDGDLSYAVNAVSYLGARVEVFALRSMTSDQLIHVANNYIDLATLREEIQKAPR